jgi:hypothetical protein
MKLVNKQEHTSNTKKSSGDWHVSNTSMGMGDYYGTGVRAKIGKMRDGMGVQTLGKKKLGTAPKSVA